jgi:hypothetical protein
MTGPRLLLANLLGGIRLFAAESHRLSVWTDILRPAINTGDLGRDHKFLWSAVGYRLFAIFTLRQMTIQAKFDMIRIGRLYQVK